MIVNVSADLKGVDFGALGYIIGKVVCGVPYFKLQNNLNINDLKPWGVALASSGSVALYHMENVTSEFELGGKENIEDIMFISDKEIQETRQNNNH